MHLTLVQKQQRMLGLRFLHEERKGRAHKEGRPQRVNRGLTTEENCKCAQKEPVDKAPKTAVVEHLVVCARCV